MSSVAIVQTLTRDLAQMLAPTEGWQRQITIVHRELTAERFSARLSDLTWNRVKSWFYAEARRIDYEEVVALRELKAMKEAQIEHRRFIAETNRLAADLAAEGAAFTRAQLDALGRIASRSAYPQGDIDSASRASAGGIDLPGDLL